MESFKRWECPKCKKQKRTETSTKATFCVSCSKWFKCIEEQTPRSYMGGRVEVHRPSIEPRSYDFQSRFPYSHTYSDTDDLGELKHEANARFGPLGRKRTLN